VQVTGFKARMYSVVSFFMSKTNRSKHTKADIALCLGERIGEFIEPNQIRIRGNWLFYNAEYLDGKEVDCYFAKNARYDSGCLCMEPWDSVKFEDSPFIPKNDEKVKKALEQLDKGYSEYLKDCS